MKYLSLFFYYIYIKNMIHNSQISLFLLILLLNNCFYLLRIMFHILSEEDNLDLKKINEIANISLFLNFFP